MEPLIRTADLHFSYSDGSGKKLPALNGVNITIQEGELVAIIGANGSGKSTLARHFNGLLRPTHGDVWVNGQNTRDPASWRDLRRTVAMVFQHPESQAVATTVEEDVAFGLENLGVPPGEIRLRVDQALGAVGLDGLHRRAPHHLSGGQKQRLALAGVLAMQPRCIVLDEATSMLDPSGRVELRNTIQALHGHGATVVMITQDMDEAAMCERVIVLSRGEITRDDITRKVMTDRAFLRSAGLDVPPITQMAGILHASRPGFPDNILTINEFIEQVRRSAWPRAAAIAGVDGSPRQTVARLAGAFPPGNAPESRPARQPIIEARDLHYTYMRGTPLETEALRGMDFTVYPGEINGLIGATGSGKSTLLQHLNALLFPQRGELRIGKAKIAYGKTDLRTVRQQIALLFQHPESQLFERFVADDVAYGPLNLGLSIPEVRQRVESAMEAVGLPISVFRDRSINSLSGGERRRAAIAGVLALEPQVLVLDEPSAGLDPRGRENLSALLRSWQAQEGRAIVWASHAMDEIAQYAGQVTVMVAGRTFMEGAPRQVFQQADVLASYGLDVPQVVQVMRGIANAGVNVPGDVLAISEAIPVLERIIQ